MKYFGQALYKKAALQALPAVDKWRWTPAHPDWLQSLKQFDWPSSIWDTRKKGKAFALFIVENDIESGALLHLLVAQDIPFLALDVNHMDQLKLQWRIGQTCTLSCAGQKIDLEMSRVCYWRWSPTRVEARDAEAAGVHARRWKSALQALASQNPGILHLPADLSQLGTYAQNRYADWHRAVGLGLAVPGTLITQDPDQIRQFHRRHRKLILLRDDCLTQDFLRPRVLSIRGLSVDKLPRRLLPAPVCVQQILSSSQHLRAVLVGKQIFCARLDLLTSANGMDWRRFPVSDVAYSPYKLSLQLQRRLFLLAQESGMRMATFDFILKDGRPYFLEMNRPGRWFFLQVFAGLPIRQAIAKQIGEGLK